MRNFVAILACLLLLLISLGTGLFQSVPFGSDEYREQVLSKENVLFNLGLFVVVVAAFALIYLVRHFVIDHTKNRTRREKEREKLITVVLGCLIVGFAMIFGLLQQIPLLRNTGIGRWFSEDRIFLNSIIVIGTTMLVVFTYWIRVIIIKPYGDDEAE